MTNPYQPPAAPPLRFITPEELRAIAPLAGQILVLRIVVAALALGVVVFAAVAVVQNLGKPQVLAGKFDVVGIAMLGFGALVGLQGIVLPGIVFRIAKPGSAVMSQFAQHSPEAQRVLAIQGRIQTATIVGCALFEGGAFANLVWYMNTGELLHLAMAGLLLLGILARFPLPGACERRIADELRRQEEGASANPVAIDRSRQV
jgi:hypothetical protein